MFNKIINTLRGENNLVGYHHGQQIRVIKVHGGLKRVVKKGRMNNVNVADKQLTQDSLIICFDRVKKANDNGEVIYQQLVDKGFTNVYFAIDANAPDYQRLTSLNYNVVEYGSEVFKSLYIHADFIFSSSCDNEIINYQGLRFDQKLNFTTKFIFLQHGVITDDMSSWLVDKRFDYIVASTEDEYQFLINDCNILPDQVLCVGLPRFKNLINQERKMILIAPTWRSYLTQDNFLISDFYHSWSKLLVELVKRYDGEINFVLHPMFNQYREMFETDININVVSGLDVDYQLLISEAVVLITDYSSIFMDFKYLDKDVYFYQFDKEHFFAQHTYNKRLDYTEFGHVIDQELNIEINHNVCDVEFYDQDIIKVLKNKLVEV